jgi:hypothetical protein
MKSSMPRRRDAPSCKAAGGPRSCARHPVRGIRVRDGAPAAGRAPVAVLGALLVLATGLTAWWQFGYQPEPPARLNIPPRDVIERALAQAAADSLALKTRWVESVPDLDLDDLDEDRREVFLRLVNARACECGCGYTLGACRNYDPDCEFSGPLARALLDSIRAGHAFPLDGIRPRPGPG